MNSDDKPKHPFETFLHLWKFSRKVKYIPSNAPPEGPPSTGGWIDMPPPETETLIIYNPDTGTSTIKTTRRSDGST